MPTQWFKMQEIQRASYFNWVVVQMKNASLGWRREFGTVDSLTVHHKGTIELHFNQPQWRIKGNAVLKKVLDNPPWLNGVIRKTHRMTRGLFTFLHTSQTIDFTKMSDQTLAQWINQFEDRRRKVHLFGVVGTILEFDHELLSQYLQQYLKQQIELMRSKRTVSGVFTKLTIFHQDTFIRKEEKAMYKLVRFVQHNPALVKFVLRAPNTLVVNDLPKRFSSFYRKLHRHYLTYRWLQYQYIGPAWQQEYFIEVLRRLLKQHINVKEKLHTFERERKEMNLLQRRLSRELKFDQYHKNLFALARELAFIKSLRNDSFFFGFYCADPILREISRRLGLSISQTRTFLPGEIQHALLKGENSSHTLRERWRYSVFAVQRGKELMLTGSRAQRLVEKIKSLKPKAKRMKEVTGTTAMVGYATGKVRIVNTVSNMKRMKEGDILVSNATYPSLVPAMKKAAAIITDLGGITSHAAIISRELGIPCVVGTKVATQLLKNGDMVEVCADTGMIKKLNK